MIPDGARTYRIQVHGQWTAVIWQHGDYYGLRWESAIPSWSPGDGRWYLRDGWAARYFDLLIKPAPSQPHLLLRGVERG